jgi:hypothetical protein
MQDHLCWTLFREPYQPENRAFLPGFYAYCRRAVKKHPYMDDNKFDSFAYLACIGDLRRLIFALFASG